MNTSQRFGIIYTITRKADQKSTRQKSKLKVCKKPKKYIVNVCEKINQSDTETMLEPIGVPRKP